MKLVLFVGSIRPGRMAERVAKMVRNYISQFEGIEVVTFGEFDRAISILNPACCVKLHYIAARDIDFKLSLSRNRD